MLWTILTGLLVALTKYLTSLRLRNLRDKIQKDQKDASSLKQQLFDVSEKEEFLKVGLRGFMWVDIGISGSWWKKCGHDFQFKNFSSR